MITKRRMKKHLVTSLLLLFMSWAVPQHSQAQFAESWYPLSDFEKPEEAFTWTAKGQSALHLKLLVGYPVEKAEYRLRDCTFYLRDDDGNETNCFFINDDVFNYTYNTSWAYIGNYLNTESTLYVTNEESHPWFVSGNENNLTNIHYKKVADKAGYLELDWYYPGRFAGKTMTLYVKGKIAQGYDNTDISPRDYAKKIGTIDFDDISVETYDAVPGTEEADYGFVRIPVSSDRVINKLSGTYTDNYDVTHELEEVIAEKNSYMVFAKVPSHEGVKRVDLKVNVATASWKPYAHEYYPNWPTQQNYDVDVTINQKIPMVHTPQLLTSEMDSKGRGTVKLKWKIGDLKHDDLLDGDVFLVQRSLTGKDLDYETIGQEYFDCNQEEYEFEDNTLISSLVDTLIDKNLGIPLVRYRVVRGAAAQLWGYVKNPAVAYTQPSLKTLYLLQPTWSNNAEWSNQDERKVTVTWEYEPTYYEMYVWDDRAEMRIEILMYNRAGTKVDSTATVLTKEQINDMKAEIQLPRSCVNYTLRLVVDPKTSPIGSGKGNIFRTIGSDDEMAAFVREMNDEKSDHSQNVILTADVKLNERICILENTWYSGNFDGNGHTIDVNISSSYLRPGIFKYIGNGAVVTNLKVMGDMVSDRIEMGGIVGAVTRGAAYIENCHLTSRYNIQNTCSENTWSSGVVGQVSEGAHLFVNNVLLRAMFDDDNEKNDCWGGFVGYKNNAATVHIANSISAPLCSYWIDKDYTNRNSATFVNYNKGEGKGIIIDNSYYQSDFSCQQGRPLSVLQKPWLNGIDDLPISTRRFSKPTGGVKSYEVKVASNLNRFYYENLGHVIENSLETFTNHSSVELAWECTDLPADYFEVWRKRKDKGDYEIIATNLSALSYLDETVSPAYDYVYKVASVSNCEGEKRFFTHEVDGACEHYGRLEGYVRFADGTGIPHVKVYIVSDDTDTSAPKVEQEAETNANGYFMADELPYGGKETRNYRVTCSLPKADLSADCGDGLPVVFDASPAGNMSSGVNFTVTSGVKISGYVMYKGTSIPVMGVSFLVDGLPVSKSSSRVESNFEGKFEFRMAKGTHSIQAVKDGHVFYEDGFYHAAEGDTKTQYAFEVDRAGIYFYDNTQVKLIGRIVGGKDQGELPLGNSLSHNNLGDNLKMVLTLEGDKSSQLVFENTDRSLTERNAEYIHKKHGQLDTDVHKTLVHTTRYRVEVTPDPKTGEYELLLPPVKWKIQQITADGYATLFQEGTTNEVIDLTDSLRLHRVTKRGEWETLGKETVYEVTEEYNAIYNRIYRAPICFDRKQVVWDKFDYFGERYFSMSNLSGDRKKIPIAYEAKEKDSKGLEQSVTKYTFGYPVFSLDRTYSIRLSVTERYYYNNDTKSDRLDVVKLSGGLVTIHNGLQSQTHRDTLSLDANGEALYSLKAAQRPYIQTGKDALYTVTFSLDRDGTKYEAEPLQAYVFGQHAKAGAQDIVSQSTPILVDILRDPPGGGSSATLSKGSKLQLSYKMDMSWAGGLTLGIQYGTKLDNYLGMQTFIAHSGVVNHTSSSFNIDLDLAFNGSGERAFIYSMTANEDISTSSSSTMVGADADLYIGMETNVFVRPSIALRAVTDSVFNLMQGRVAAGTVVEVARGIGDDNQPYHLIRDEILAYGQKVNSTFIHSQQHIIKQIIPNLNKQCNDLMYTGTQAEAAIQANATGKPVYLSLIDNPENQRFGAVNADKKGNYVYYTLKDGKINNTSVDQSKMNYIIVLPTGYDDSKQEDKVKDFGDALLAWGRMIAANEEDKLAANELVKNFDVDGGSSFSYSEEFSSKYSKSQSYSWLATPFSHNYMSNLDPNNPGDSNLAQQIWSVLGAAVGKFVAAFDISVPKGAVTNNNYHNDANNNVNLDISFAGSKWTFSLTPIASYGSVPTSATSNEYSRKESFKIALTKQSHLDFDVYRVALRNQINETVDAQDVFLNVNYKNYEEYVKYFLDRDVGSVSITDDYKVAKGFVYRTRAGATARPWEDERKSIFYNPGTVIDARTKKIENPVIKMDKQSISGVPYGEPARFKLYMTNDSEAPDAVYGVPLSYYTLYQDTKNNPAGVKMTVDGIPLTNNGTSIRIEPGEVTEKVLEVWAGEDFDYENLVIGLISTEDVHIYSEVTFDVHYQRQAGKVEIASPGNKWIMNTDAPIEGAQGWYMPVIISGFDRNQNAFDHIEFQYKESTRGDDYWTNLCSFYADSTYYKMASGTRQMIPDNGNIVTKFYGDGREMEKAYDLRARLFCRNGNGYLTSDSEVLSGIKDTRLPRLFGVPEPRDGVLGAGDNIIFNFSENIEYNYLSGITNFEVKGETNETALSEEPSLQFSGQGYAQSEAVRNFSEKSVTVEMMVKPASTNQDMPLFSHGTDGNALQLWLTADGYLKAIVSKQDAATVELKSTQPIGKEGFQHVAMVLDADAQSLKLYNNGKIGEVGQVSYNGYGPLVFGSTNEMDISLRKHYTGRMLESRVWYRAMDAGLLSTYGNTRLTGYEMGLIDYYPMNEGKGSYAGDAAQGAHLSLNGASWALPQGMSLRLDKTEAAKGMKLNQKFMSRPAEADYTLMFWFKTTDEGKGTLLSNGSGRKTDATDGTFFIGFEDNDLKYRSGGKEYILGSNTADNFSNDRWHHFAMTVNRGQQLANIYVDNALKAQFSTDSLGGMVGNDFYLGNMVWHEKGDADVMHQANALTGHIDGLCLFAQALPPTLINRYSSKSPGGKEKGLITYMGFNRQERQPNNELVLKPYGLNQVIYTDMDGNETNRVDTVLTDKLDVVMAHIDQATGAPMQAYEELRNLNFSFVGKDNQLLVHIDEPDARVNKQNLFVTVYDIPDLNGNHTASPYTWALFVDRNPLRWSQKVVNAKTYTYQGDNEISINIQNNSGMSHTYTVENLPRWITVDKSSDIIGAKSEQTLTFTISNDVNAGSYDEMIYLTDENGLSEPLCLNLTVEAEQPLWAVEPALKKYSMNIVGRVQIGSDIVTDKNDIVGVFDADGTCRGVSNVEYNSTTGKSMVYITAFDSTKTSFPLYFRLWHHPTGKTMVLTPSEKINFTVGGTVGTAKDPIVFQANNMYIQQIELNEGWNWISFNVTSNEFRDLKGWLGAHKWYDNDIILNENNGMTLYRVHDTWLSDNGNDLANYRFSPSESYHLYTTKARSMEVQGYSLSQPTDRTVNLKKGWNSIGYAPMVNLPVSTALADYFDKAKDGDVVKSREAFAIFFESGSSRGWEGNLKYMKPGEGYMLYHQGDAVTFTYPFFEPGTFYMDDTKPKGVRAFADYPSTMSLVATVAGIILQEGDQLQAFCNGELRGEVTYAEDAETEVMFMSIAGKGSGQLSFAIERDGDIIATSGEVMNYENDAVSGTPNTPTSILFVQMDKEKQHGWYTLQGIKLPSAPTKSGVYIHDGRKRIIK